MNTNHGYATRGEMSRSFRDQSRKNPSYDVIFTRFVPSPGCARSFSEALTSVSGMLGLTIDANDLSHHSFIRI